MKEFEELVQKYQLFENENYGDNMPYYLQQRTVEDFISTTIQKEIERERREIVEEMNKNKTELLSTPAYNADQNYDRGVKEMFTSIQEFIKNRK